MSGIAFQDGQIVFKANGEIGFGTACCCEQCVVFNENISSIGTAFLTLNSFSTSGSCSVNTEQNRGYQWETTLPLGTFTGTTSVSLNTDFFTGPGCSVYNDGSPQCLSYRIIATASVSSGQLTITRWLGTSSASCIGTPISDTANMVLMSVQSDVRYLSNQTAYISRLVSLAFQDANGKDLAFESSINDSMCSTASSHLGPFSFTGPNDSSFINPNTDLATVDSYSITVSFT